MFSERRRTYEAERDDSLQGKGNKFGKKPLIMLQGKWLRDMGFSTGDRIAVTCVDGKLIVERTGKIWSDQKGAGMVAEENAEYRTEAV